MIIETTCEHGVVRLPRELSFRRDTFTVKVDVPDQELLPAEQEATALDSPAETSKFGSLRTQIDAILGPYKEQLKNPPPCTPQDYKDMWHEHLEDRYLSTLDQRHATPPITIPEVSP